MYPNASFHRQPSIALMGLQALAPIMIFTSHWTEGLFDNPLYQGQLSIDFFFAVEGFLASVLLFQTGSNTTFWKLMGYRLLHIYPLYIMGMLISVCLAVLLAQRGILEWPLPVVRQAVLWNSFFLPTFIDPSFVFPLNPPTWAIALEIYAFALFCAVRRWLSLPVLLPLVIVAAFVCLLTLFLARDPNMGYLPQTYWGGLTRCLFCFFYGVLTQRLIQRYGQVLPSVNPLFIWAAFLGILFVPSRYVSLPLLLIFLPLLVWLAAVAKSPEWLRGPGEHAGRLAYGLYLLSYPILIGFHHLPGIAGTPSSALGLALYYAMVLVTIVAVAYGATRLLEFAFLKRLAHVREPSP